MALVLVEEELGVEVVLVMVGSMTALAEGASVHGFLRSHGTVPSVKAPPSGPTWGGGVPTTGALLGNGTSHSCLLKLCVCPQPFSQQTCIPFAQRSPGAQAVQLPKL